MKFTALKIIIFTIVIISFLYLLSWTCNFGKEKNFHLGVSFSELYAKQLGLDWEKAYLSILNDLNPENLRLIAYWDYIEPQKGKFDFHDLDWQIAEAKKKNKKIILAIGYRVPRWPECHLPNWAKEYTNQEFRKEILGLLTKIVNHYKNNNAIKSWQVENEPLFLVFGNCPPPNREFLKKEIALVKSLDKTRPVTVTDSGELSLWLRISGISETLGVSLYRTVWNKNVGYYHHLYSPFFYSARAYMVKKLFHNEKVIISELQGELWAPNGKSLPQIPLKEQLALFKPETLKKNLDFAKRTGINEIYFWGAEWWFWLKEKQGSPAIWNEAKQLFSSQK